MAIFRLSAKIVGRSRGHNVVGGAAYRAGVRLADLRTGRTYDYRYRRDVAHQALLLPADAPAWARERASLWGSVELGERRKDLQLAREYLLALPHELDEAGRLELVSSWAGCELVARGVVVDLVIYRPGPHSDGRNHHAHLLTSLRRLEATGWTKKTRDLNQKAFLLSLRSSWAEAINAQLERAGRTERVAHRSLAAQRHEALALGNHRRAALLDRRPEPKLGVAAAAMEHRARWRHPSTAPVTERGQAQAEAQRERAAAQVLAGEMNNSGSSLAPAGIEDAPARRKLAAATEALAAKERRLEGLRLELEEDRLAREREHADAYSAGWAQGWAAARRNT